MILIKNPTWDSAKGMLMIPANNLNVFTATEVHDNVNRYQQKFKVFSHMSINDEKEFTIITLEGLPFVWQPTQVCTWSPLGHLSIGQKSIAPSKAMINHEWCQDELINSLFKYLLVIRNSRIELDPLGEAIFNKVITKISEMAVLGAWLTLTIGQLYANTVNFKADADATVETLFNRTIGTVRGWVELLRQTALQGAKYAHLNTTAFETDDFNGVKYVGDPIELFDKLREAAPADLQALIDEGGIQSTLEGAQPLFIVSSSVHKQIADKYRLQCSSVTCLNPRLTQTNEAGFKVYYIDDIPVIPMSYISYMDRYLLGTTHFAAISLSGNIQLGSSFGAIPNLNTPTPVGLAIQTSSDLYELGKVRMAAHSYFATAIADPTLIVATQVYAEAAV